MSSSRASSWAGSDLAPRDDLAYRGVDLLGVGIDEGAHRGVALCHERSLVEQSASLEQLAHVEDGDGIATSPERFDRVRISRSKRRSEPFEVLVARGTDTKRREWAGQGLDPTPTERILLVLERDRS